MLEECLEILTTVVGVNVSAVRLEVGMSSPCSADRVVRRRSENNPVGLITCQRGRFKQ